MQFFPGQLVRMKSVSKNKAWPVDWYFACDNNRVLLVVSSTDVGVMALDARGKLLSVSNVNVEELR